MSQVYILCYFLKLLLLHIIIPKYLGVRIGQATKVDGDSVRSGVTVILPRDPADIQIPCYAGMHTLNGNGEVTGCYQIKDWGYINTVRLVHEIICL